MKKNKVGTIFMISVLALAGIGITYAGFIDELKVYGTVDTATVDLEIEDYSGTYVWKIWGDGAPGDEVYVTHDPEFDPSGQFPNAEYMLVSSAEGRDPTANDPPDYDGIIEFDNLFPCVDFMADIVFHYVGSIPVKITSIEWDWTGEPLYDLDGTLIADDWIQWLMDNGYMTGGFYWYDPATGELGDEVGVGTQLHYSHRIKLIVTIHLPQENFLQGLSGSGWVDIEVMQWNDECGEGEVDIEVTKTVDDDNPPIESQITYTVTATNLGPDDATGVVVQDILPDDVDYFSHVASQGTYSPPPGSELWNVGSLIAGASATLDITVTVNPPTTTTVFTQMALVLDGSGSIGSSDFGIMLEGLATAVENYMPHDGMIELTVVHFADLYANVEVPPTVITAANFQAVADAIRVIPYRGGYTPLASGFYLTADQLLASPNFDVDNRQVINVVTDGAPNVVPDLPDKYSGTYIGFTQGKAAAVIARNYLISTLGLTSDGVSFGMDELDMEAIDVLSGDFNWMRDTIVWPQPGFTSWPPTGPGWIREIATYTEFADTIGEKFLVIFESITNCAALVDVTPEDINPLNDEDCVTIVPQPAI